MTAIERLEAATKIMAIVYGEEHTVSLKLLLALIEEAKQ